MTQSAQSSEGSLGRAGGRGVVAGYVGAWIERRSGLGGFKMITGKPSRGLSDAGARGWR